MKCQMESQRFQNYLEKNGENFDMLMLLLLNLEHVQTTKLVSQPVGRWGLADSRRKNDKIPSGLSKKTGWGEIAN